jgi:hypothetical protein
MRVVWDALGQVIREVLCWVLVLVIADEGICYGAYNLTQGSRYGRRPMTFPEGGGIGFGTSDGLCVVVISNIHIVRTLGKSHVVRPCQFTLEVINGESRSSDRKGITTHG